jgi:hypothetical protein
MYQSGQHYFFPGMTRYAAGKTHWNYVNETEAAYGYRNFPGRSGHSRLGAGERLGE